MTRIHRKVQKLQTGQTSGLSLTNGPIKCECSNSFEIASVLCDELENLSVFQAWVFGGIILI